MSRVRERSSIGWPLIIIVSAIATMLVVVTNVETPLRPAIVFWFLLVCPGMAVMQLLRFKDGVMELTLAIALSISLDAIIAEGMVLTKRWSPEWGFVLLAGLSMVGALSRIIMVKSEAETRERR
jgi:uncharacterized membrane protein